MAFSEIELKKVDKLVGGLCQKRSPAHLKDKLSTEYRVKGHDVVIFERRPSWHDPDETTESPVAKMKFVRTVGEWRLYWMRRDLKWYGYEMLHSSKDLKVRNGPFPQSLHQSAKLVVRRTSEYASAQFLAFLDLAKNCSFLIV